MTRAAELLGCSRATIDNYCNKHPEIKQICTDYRESILDKAEDKLLEAVTMGQAWAIALVISKLGRTRGYADKQEVSGPDSGPLEIIIKRE